MEWKWLTWLYHYVRMYGSTSVRSDSNTVIAFNRHARKKEGT